MVRCLVGSSGDSTTSSERKQHHMEPNQTLTIILTFPHNPTSPCNMQTLRQITQILTEINSHAKITKQRTHTHITK